MSAARRLAAHMPLDSVSSNRTVDDDVTRIRTRYREALDAGMSLAEATEHANGPENRASEEDEAARIRTRFAKARRDGLSTDEATAYANGSDSAEPVAPAQVGSPGPAIATDGSSDGPLHLINGSESAATASLSPMPLVSAESTAQNEEVDADCGADHPPQLVLR